MAIDATKMTTKTHRKRGRSAASSTYVRKCVSSTSRSATATGFRRGGQPRLQPVSPGLLLSVLVVVLRGGSVAAPPPSLAFAAGPCVSRSVVLGRCDVLGNSGCVRDINSAAARAARRGVCLMATVGSDKDEEKMELAAEVG